MAKQQKDIFHDYLQLARIALAGRPQDVQFLLHKASKEYRASNPHVADALVSLLQEAPTRSSPLRKYAEAPLPVDVDSRLQLLRVDNTITDRKPTTSPVIESRLQQVLSERRNEKALLKLGLHPTKSMLLTGPPGVGKTLTARWIAHKLEKPLLILDLAAVMSSYLGRTGNNIRFVLDYAKQTQCVLLLDELDAIAKRRDDGSEVGELKRLVTVLLQEIDDWPHSGLLIAATNHPDLLDPAIWRRFDTVLNFDLPGRVEIKEFVSELLSPYISTAQEWSEILSYALTNKSYSEIEKIIFRTRKIAALNQTEIDNELLLLLNGEGLNLSHDAKVDLACELIEQGIVSQRRAQELTGVARDTIRKHSKK